MIKFQLSCRKASCFNAFPSSFRRSLTADAVSVNVKQQMHQTQKDFSQERKMSALELQHLRRKGKKITMITAYDYPTAKHAENAGFDILLVGDSVGMVCLGYDTTQPVTMEEMLHHCKAARRGAPSRFIVGDMPFGSYELGSEKALTNAFRLIKEAGCDAVKLEGGKNRAETVAKLVDSGIAVMGHVGLTPQGISVLGGFRAQGRTAIKARSIIDDALALQQAGAFAVGKRNSLILLLPTYPLFLP
jgi:3-methyl-2-oxobutanoate hydroxymethyltransferase